MATIAASSKRKSHRHVMICQIGKGLLGGRKNNENDLYARFLRSPNFRIWYNSRRKEAIRGLQETYQNIILQTDIQSVLKDRNEIEIVDLYMRIQEQLEMTQTKTPLKTDVIDRLAEHLDATLICMPKGTGGNIALIESE